MDELAWWLVAVLALVCVALAAQLWLRRLPPAGHARERAAPPQAAPVEARAGSISVPATVPGAADIEKITKLVAGEQPHAALKHVETLLATIWAGGIAANTAKSRTPRDVLRAGVLCSTCNRLRLNAGALRKACNRLRPNAGAFRGACGGMPSATCRLRRRRRSRDRRRLPPRSRQ